jgi:LacI family transcriptional regulator
VLHRLASVRLTEFLLDLGHREFAVIAGAGARNDRTRDRLVGTREALASHGIELCAPGFTAVVCGNDLLALGALHDYARRGIEVPRQMAVATPPHTTVSVPAADIGRLAAERMPAPLGGEHVAGVEEVRFLIVRASTGRATR